MEGYTRGIVGKDINDSTTNVWNSQKLKYIN